MSRADCYVWACSDHGIRAVAVVGAVLPTERTCFYMDEDGDCCKRVMVPEYRPVDESSTDISNKDRSES